MLDIYGGNILQPSGGGFEEVRLRLRVQGPNIERDEVLVGRNGLMVGRTDDNSLPLKHREISRQHMRIMWRDDDRYLVEDLNSSNGVFLNEVRLQPRIPIELKVGDTIRLGPFVIVVLEYVLAQIPSVVRPARSIDDAGDAPVPVPERAIEYIPGVPRDRSTWMQYLPEIYGQDEFLGRFMLIFESLFSPIVWQVDNFQLYLDPQTASQEWLQWMASWFDLLLLDVLPVEHQRRIMAQLGWLFLRRGTRSGLERLLELYFGVKPEILENEPCHFEVILPLSESKTTLTREVAERLINSQKPAFASYKLTVT